MCVGTGFLFVLISILTEGAVGMSDIWAPGTRGQCCTRNFQHAL